MPELRLDGCTPEPLMGYLKALGVLRLVAEQADPEVRGAWRDGVFILETKLAWEELVSFFLNKYRPTPLLAPWNGGSGFYIKLDLEKLLESNGSQVEFKSREAVEAIDGLAASDVERLSSYRQQIASTKAALGRLAEPINCAALLAEQIASYRVARIPAQKKAAKDQATKLLNSLLLFQSGSTTYFIGKAGKDEFISDLRGKVLTDDGLFWLDAALAMRTGQKKNRVESPTLGSGGNIGNSDFSARFAQLLCQVIPFSQSAETPPKSTAWLQAGLFGVPAAELLTTSVDQFDPGKAGGANETQGMAGEPMLNPWDYILMMEGALVLAGNTSRRLGANRDAASFPFVVHSSLAGYGTIGQDNTRGELWLPLWDSYCGFHEIRFVLSEGRAEVGRQRAWSGVSFAQAVAGLGVDRGIETFVRYEFQERLGQSYLATPIGRFDVPNGPREGIELVRSLNSMPYEVRSLANDSQAPTRFSSCARRIDSAVFDFCKYGGADRLAKILAGIGAIEREFAAGALSPDKRRLRFPLAGFSPDWISASDDKSPEYRLARSLAFLHGDPQKTGPIRRYLEPVKKDRRRWVWTERGGHVVWAGGDLAQNLGAVLSRRVMDAESTGEESLPLHSPFRSSLADVGEFLTGKTEDQRVEDLLWGLMLIDSDQRPKRQPQAGGQDFLPGAYALLKLTLLPFPLKWERRNNSAMLTAEKGGSGARVRPEPAILAKLRAGDVPAACEIAARRLRASGFTPLASHLANGSRRNISWSAGFSTPRRLLAALIFPISDQAVNDLAKLVLRIPSIESLVEGESP